MCCDYECCCYCCCCWHCGRCCYILSKMVIVATLSSSSLFLLSLLATVVLLVVTMYVPSLGRFETMCRIGSNTCIRTYTSTHERNKTNRKNENSCLLKLCLFIYALLNIEQVAQAFTLRKSLLFAFSFVNWIDLKSRHTHTQAVHTDNGKMTMISNVENTEKLIQCTKLTMPKNGRSIFAKFSTA